MHFFPHQSQVVVFVFANALEILHRSSNKTCRARADSLHETSPYRHAVLVDLAHRRKLARRNLARSHKLNPAFVHVKRERGTLLARILHVKLKHHHKKITQSKSERNDPSHVCKRHWLLPAGGAHAALWKTRLARPLVAKPEIHLFFLVVFCAKGRPFFGFNNQIKKTKVSGLRPFFSSPFRLSPAFLLEKKTFCKDLAPGKNGKPNA